MRWWTFFILAYVTVCLQQATAGYVNFRGYAPNLVLPVVVFVAMHARREEGLLAAALLGALQDMAGQHPLGLYTFSYGLAALFMVGAQPAVYRDHPLTHLVMTLGAALLCAAVTLFNQWARPLLHGTPQPRPEILPLLGGAAYTALLAPLFALTLGRLKRTFGFSKPRGFSSAGT